MSFLTSVTNFSLIRSFCSSSSSRRSRHLDTGAGPRHLAGWLGQQQFPGADLPSHPPDSGVSLGGPVAAVDHTERRHQPDRVRGVPHGNLHRHRANHRPKRTERDVLHLHGAVMKRNDCRQVDVTHPGPLRKHFRAHFFLFDLLLLDTAAFLGFIHHTFKHYEAVRIYRVTAAILQCPRRLAVTRISSHVVQSNDNIIMIKAKSFLQLGDDLNRF